jgi:cell division protein FtsW
MATKKQTQRGYDYSLLIPTLILLGLGLVTIYSASSLLAAHKLGDGYYYLKKQAVFCLLGFWLYSLSRVWGLRWEVPHAG